MIDYENVQPKNLSLLAAEHFRIWLFIGQSLSKVPVELAKAMQALGHRGKYVQISGNGPNALDFHIACYIGRISVEEPDAFFHIISKDTGFDPLIAHLKELGIFSKRSSAIDGIPVLRSLTEAPKDEQVDAVKRNLQGMATNKPQKERTLRAMIAAWFGNKLAEKDIDRIVTALVQHKLIAIEDGKLRYSLS
ncbi:MAG: PIN domain-containing protein [Pseudomonadota bacterium]